MDQQENGEMKCHLKFEFSECVKKPTLTTPLLSTLAKTMENAWQYSKVYSEHADEVGNPTQKYWDWAKAGWENPKAVPQTQ